MNSIFLNIARDFSDSPGARFIAEGSASGEEFYKKFLKPKFLDALENNKTLVINLDGTNGYATSFLDESFGKLSREFSPKQVTDKINLISVEEPLLIQEIIDEYINQSYKRNIFKR